MNTQKWYTGEDQDLATKQTQYLTTDPDFAKGYGTVYSVVFSIAEPKTLYSNDIDSLKSIVDNMFEDYENGELNTGLNEVIQFCLESSDNDVDNAKESLIEELSPTEIENESSYDNDDITEYICSKTDYEIIIFSDLTTALLLDPTKAKYVEYDENENN